MKVDRASTYFYWFATIFAGFWVILGFVSLWAAIIGHAPPTDPIKLWLTALMVWLGGWMIRRRYGRNSN